MQEIAKGVVAGFAVALTFGAVQFASGRDFSGGTQARSQYSPRTAEAAVNRSAKSDRAAGVSEPREETRTISVRLDALSDTSILLRLPVPRDARNRPSTPLLKSGDGKMTVACEPMVSMLTEVAKLLQPGRCVT
jgi:preprotein translocase subunit SecF